MDSAPHLKTLTPKAIFSSKQNHAKYKGNLEFLLMTPP
jgi:hypothetical protein